MRVIFPKNKFIYFKRTNFRGQKLSRFWSRKFVHPYSTPFLSMLFTKSEHAHKNYGKNKWKMITSFFFSFKNYDSTCFLYLLRFFFRCQAVSLFILNHFVFGDLVLLSKCRGRGYKVAHTLPQASQYHEIKSTRKLIHVNIS